MKCGKCTSFVDLAKRWDRGIGSVTLKDGSSVKILGDSKDNAVDFFRIKNNSLLNSWGYYGKDSVCKAANDVCALEKYAQNPADVDKAWQTCFDVVR